MSRAPIYDEYDAFVHYEAGYVRRMPKRKPTLAGVIRQARRAGIDVTGATVTTDGVSLQFGKRAIAGPAQVEDDLNEWDVVKQ